MTKQSYSLHGLSSFVGNSVGSFIFVCTREEMEYAFQRIRSIVLIGATELKLG